MVFRRTMVGWCWGAAALALLVLAEGKIFRNVDWDIMENNPCLHTFCRLGEQCEVVAVGVAGEQPGLRAHCICRKSCPERPEHPEEAVCGSDGRLYPSACHLEMAACNRRSLGATAGDPLERDPSNKCFRASELETTSAFPVTTPMSSKDGEADPALLDGDEDEDGYKEVDDLAAAAADEDDDNNNNTNDGVDDEDEDDDEDEEDDDDSSNNGKGVVSEADERLRMLKAEINCSPADYESTKDRLLLSQQKKLQGRYLPGKNYVLRRMFMHYDLNSNGYVDVKELDEVSEVEGLSWTGTCLLSLIVQREDKDRDHRLDIHEFTEAFSKVRLTYPLEGVSVVSLDKALEVVERRARQGESVELHCDVNGSPPPPIVWERNGVHLGTSRPEDQVDLGEAAEVGEALPSTTDAPQDEAGYPYPGYRVFQDGSLFLARVQLFHAGNYTCHALRNQEVVQTHHLSIHTAPRVRATPRVQTRKPGEDAVMYCHVVGEPFPQVQWLKNEEPLRMSDPRKYVTVGNGTELRIRGVEYSDTGAYMCQAESVGGVDRDLSSLIVLHASAAAPRPLEEHRFFTFHDHGISIHDPKSCHLVHRIDKGQVIPGTQNAMCGKGPRARCSWGHAINVANRYIYAAQPTLNRVLVISKAQMLVVDVIVTSLYPVELAYDPHRDVVWVLNWRSEKGTGKTVQVVREASQKLMHQAEDPPREAKIGDVMDLYLPPYSQDVAADITLGAGRYARSGYLLSPEPAAELFRVDLSLGQPVRGVTLPEACSPQHVALASLYGTVLVQCAASGLLTLDYLTDTVTGRYPDLQGKPHVSPDSRRVAVIHRGQDGVTIVVMQVMEDGLHFRFDVKTTLNVSDVVFFPSRSDYGYDLFASATDRDDVLFVDLSTGKVEMITGLGAALPASRTEWGAPNRPIVASGVFGRFMASPAYEAVYVINGHSRTVHCEIGGVLGPRTVVWATVQH